jgi:serine-type D-Ala-D-Ala carboxypeptidase (penicillin-binding protein 5/6)
MARIRWIVGLIVALVVAGAVVQFVRPLPKASAHTSSALPTRVAGSAPHLPWPGGGVQAAEDVEGVGFLGQSGPTQPMAIGSVAKMMTALLVLKHHPLALYANGPTLTITAADTTAYLQDVATNQSVLPVTDGERLSERTLLEGLLVASANNVANLLAVWVDGSTSAFTAEMNSEAKSLGLTNTHFSDVSGLDPATVSTAADQTKLAEIAMKNPTFAMIVAMPQMAIPSGGISYNYNDLLGRDGIIGVKTGSTVVGGASFIWAAQRSGVTIYGGVLGQGATTKQNQLQQALDDGAALINAAVGVIEPVTVFKTGQEVGQLVAPWSAAVPLVVSAPVHALGWGGLPIKSVLKTTLPSGGDTGVAAGTRVGTLTVTVGSQVISVPVVTKSALPAPSPQWRLTRH